MALTLGDKKSVKNIVKSELTQQLGPKLEKVEGLIAKNLDQRLGPKLEKVEGLIAKNLDQRLGPKLEKVDKLINKNLDQRLGPHLENVGKLVKQLISEDETLVRKDDIKNLPSRDEFFTKMDELLTEVKTSREEQTLLSHKVSVHSDQIEVIQKHFGISASN